MDTVIYLTLVIATAFLLGCVVGAKTGRQIDRALDATQQAVQPPSGPHVVVNLPPDWKPLETVPPTQIEGAKATLWWTVYKATFGDADDYGTITSQTYAAQTARASADAAVTMAFPSSS